MAVSRKPTISITLLILIAFMGVSSLVFLYYTIQDELSYNQGIFREDNLWGASQIEREARVFRNHLLLYASGFDEISLEDLKRKFDVLWSRIENMDKGEIGRLYMQLEGAEFALQSGKSILRQIDPLLLELKREDKEKYNSILSHLDPFIDNVYAVSRNASARALKYQESKRTNLERKGQRAIFLFSGIFLSGMVLFYILIRNQYRLNLMTDNLQEKVEIRTIELEDSDYKCKMMTQAIEQSSVSVIICDVKGKIEYVNPRFVEVTGYSFKEVLGKNPRFLQSGQTSMETYQKMWQSVHADRIWKGEICNRRKDGELLWEYVSFSPIKSRHNVITGYLAVKEDITQRKEYEEQLLKQANYDSLTGLPNRSLAMDRLNQAILSEQRRGGKVALLFIDLDDFKQINDTLGHDQGDIVLKMAAQRFVECLRDCDTAARFGGDEFIIILSELRDFSDVIPIVERILEAFSLPFDLAESGVLATTSIGISIYPENGSTPGDLLKCSDSAMYEAKKKGKNAYAFFKTPENL